MAIAKKAEKVVEPVKEPEVVKPSVALVTLPKEALEGVVAHLEWLKRDFLLNNPNAGSAIEGQVRAIKAYL